MRNGIVTDGVQLCFERYKKNELQKDMNYE